MSLVAGIVIPLLTVTLTLSGGWLVTTRVTDRWDEIKKRREMDAASASEFQRLYGEFFATWKIWDSILKYTTKTKPSVDRVHECLTRAAAIEGGIEALLAKVASERFLSKDDIDALGAVRQGFQALREAIRAEATLGWGTSDAEPYSAFKGLCAYASYLLGNSPGQRGYPDYVLAASSFQNITDNKHEDRWIDTAERLNLMRGNSNQIHSTVGYR